MQWIALGYGLALGVLQFFVIRAVCKRAFAKTDPGPAGPLVLGLAGYMLAAGAAVYLFSELLVWTGGGMLGAMVLTAVLWLVHKVRKLSA
jgi:hypothetical protein